MEVVLRGLVTMERISRQKSKILMTAWEEEWVSYHPVLMKIEMVEMPSLSKRTAWVLESLL